MLTDAEIAARRGVASHRSFYCWSLPEGCSCGRRMTKEQANARWEAWIAEVPARAAFFPIIMEDSEESD
jgi:hypothetical protein